MSSQGPDQVEEAQNLTTFAVDQYVKLRIPTGDRAPEIETRSPLSIPGKLTRIAKEYDKHDALAYKVDEEWVTITYSEYLTLVKNCAKGFIHLGLRRSHSVCILASNSPEWFIANLAAIFAGGIGVGIYTTNTPEACLHCMQVSNAKICVVQNEMQLAKIWGVKEHVKDLKIILIEGTVSEETKQLGVTTWQSFMDNGDRVADEMLENALKRISINECCTIVFTSGTTGEPKAAMLSHDNLLFDAQQISVPFDIRMGEESIVSYLPLSHAAAQIMDIYLPMVNAACVYFADENALRGTLTQTLLEVRPTVFLGVPRVYEKMCDGIKGAIREHGGCRRRIVQWGRSQCLQYFLNIHRLSDGKPWGYWLANSYIFPTYKQQLGLDKCRSFGCAGAPLPSNLKKFFLSVDMPIIDGYGMTECSGGHIANPTTFNNLLTIGKTLKAFKTKLSKVDKQGVGEILLYGRNVFMGYLGDEELTKEAVDVDGWLHTGDLAKMDDEGYVYVMGRLKEIVITAGGENVAPQFIEQNIREALPVVSHCVLIGNGRRFLTVLLTLKTEIDMITGGPLDVLRPEVREWLARLGCPAETSSQVIAAGPDQRVLRAVTDAISGANNRAVNNAQKVQKFTLLPEDFSVASGELAPTGKLRRQFIEEKYIAIVENLYQ